MYSYLRGIGFSEIDSRIKLEKLLARSSMNLQRREPIR